jgi:hypothetical protein
MNQTTQADLLWPSTPPTDRQKIVFNVRVLLEDSTNQTHVFPDTLDGHEQLKATIMRLTYQIVVLKVGKVFTVYAEEKMK